MSNLMKLKCIIEYIDTYIHIYGESVSTTLKETKVLTTP